MGQAGHMGLEIGVFRLEMLPRQALGLDLRSLGADQRAKRLRRQALEIGMAPVQHGRSLTGGTSRWQRPKPD